MPEHRTGLGGRVGLWALWGMVSVLSLAPMALSLNSSPDASRLSAISPAVIHGGIRFAFADLDGDREPDLAFIEVEQQEGALKRYSIRLRFGSGRESRIGVAIRSGGLSLAARDVNGDDKVDLIVSSDLEARVIEVLLNDGHGAFSIAEPGIYDAAAADRDFRMQALNQSFRESIPLPPFRSNLDGEEAARRAGALPRSTNSIVAQEELVRLGGPRCTSSGRAPPAVVLFG